MSCRFRADFGRIYCRAILANDGFIDSVFHIRRSVFDPVEALVVGLILREQKRLWLRVGHTFDIQPAFAVSWMIDMNTASHLISSHERAGFVLVPRPCVP